jgi:hypothetical protein
MVDSSPNFLVVPKHRLLAYLQGFVWLAQFGHLFVGDRLNCGSIESRGIPAVAPKTEQQTANLDQIQNSV